MSFIGELKSLPESFRNKYNLVAPNIRDKAHEVMPILQELLSYEDLERYPYVHAEIEYFIGQAAFETAMSSFAIDHLTKAESLFHKLGVYEKEIHVQGYIGLTYMAEGNFANAIVSFSKQFIYANRYHLDLAFYKANLQLGQCFYAIKDYETAFTYYLSSDFTLEQHPEIAHQTESVPVHYAVFTLNSIAMNNLDLAQTYWQKLQDSLLSVPRFKDGSYDLITTCILQLSLSKKHDEQYVNHILDLLIDHDGKSGNTLLIDNEYLKYLTDHNYLEQALRYANYVSSKISDTDYYRIQQTIYKCRAAVYRKLNEMDQAYDELMKFVNVSTRLREIEVNSSLAYLEVRSELEQAFSENEILLTVSNTDYLTKVANRRALDSKFNDIYNHAVQHHSPISFVVIDLDKFKVINDTYGHQAGDECLSLLGTILSSHQNELCFPARFGGDEFALIFHDTSEEDVLRIMHAIQDEFAHSSLCEKDIPATLSFGYCHSIPQVNHSMEHYFSIADANLYQSKSDRK